jgi:hypothetical protein
MAEQTTESGVAWARWRIREIFGDWTEASMSDANVVDLAYQNRLYRGPTATVQESATAAVPQEPEPQQGA